MTKETIKRGWSEPWETHETGREYYEYMKGNWCKCNYCGRSWDNKRFITPAGRCIGEGAGPKRGGVPWKCEESDEPED